MAAPAVLKIDIIADATKAAAALNKTGDAATKTGSKFSAAGKAIGGALAVGAVVSFGKGAVAAAEESAVATAKLENVMRKTGDAHGDAARAAEAYATKLMLATGVDDEAIMGAQAALAAFKGVNNETARAAGIFDRATGAAADLAAAGFGDLEGNAKLLGKALSDPIKGTAKLAKVGVILTDAQKAQVAAMVKAGDALGAQKLLLGQIEGRVGGTAAATVTSSQKMKVAFGELQEKVGAQLLPVIKTATDVFLKYQNVILPVAGVLLGIVLAVKAYSLASKAWSAVSKAAAAAQWLWNAAMTANPIGLVVIAIAALIAGVVLAYKKVGWFRDLIDAVWHTMVKAFDAIKGAAVSAFDWLHDNWPLLLAIITGPFGLAALFVSKHWGDILDWFKSLPRLLKSAFSGLADIVTAPWRAAVSAIAGLWNSTVGKLSFKVPGWVPGLGGKGWDVPDMPTLMTGGTVLRTGLAVVHAGETFSGVGRSSSSGSTVVNINVQTTGLGSSSPEIQRAVANALRGYTRRNGPLDIAVSG